MGLLILYVLSMIFTFFPGYRCQLSAVVTTKESGCKLTVLAIVEQLSYKVITVLLHDELCFGALPWQKREILPNVRYLFREKKVIKMLFHFFESVYNFISVPVFFFSRKYQR